MRQDLTARFTGIALAAGLIGCTDTSSPPAAVGTLFCPTGGSGAAATFDAAVAATPPGGQIVVCDGVWALDDQLIDRPLTIRSQHAGRASITDADTSLASQAGRPAIRVTGFTSGQVRFVDLTFVIGNRGVVMAPEVPGTTRDSIAGATYDQIVFDSTHWSGKNNTISIGVYVRSSSVPTAHIEFTRSTSSDIFITVFGVGSVPTDVHSSTFTRNGQAGVDYSGGFEADAAWGTTDNNTFHLCGPNGCIRVVGGGAVAILGNQMDGTPGVASLGAVVVRRATTGTHSDVVTIKDNVITGAPILGATGAQAWTFQAGVSLADPSTALHVVTGNQVGNVYAGIDATADANAHDNTFSGGAFGIIQSSLHTVQFNRNDLTGFTTSFQAPGGPGSYTCNWWGQSSGPILQTGSTTPSSLYTPFATATIAGKSTSCP
jgi:hypothetical protein